MQWKTMCDGEKIHKYGYIADGIKPAFYGLVLLLDDIFVNKINNLS